MKIFKIYTADYSKEGYEQGINASKNNKPKSGFGLFKTINPLNYVWGFKNAHESYNQNYEKGYLDGQRVNNQIYQSNQVTGSRMEHKDSYNSHIKMLGELRKTLKTLKQHLAEMTEKYEEQINTAESAGFMMDYVNPLRDRHREFETEIKMLTNLIASQMTTIKRHEDIIEDLKVGAENNE